MDSELPPAQRVPLPRLVGHGCFACGTENPVGLRMQFYRLGQTVCADVTLPRHFMGWDLIAHGGIVATLLDEAMAYAVIAFEQAFFVTRRMELRYLRPVPLEVPLTVEGRVDPEPLDRGRVTLGRILDAAQTVLAEARAEMVFVPEHKLRFSSPALLEDMRLLFAKMRGAT